MTACSYLSQAGSSGVEKTVGTKPDALPDHERRSRLGKPAAFFVIHEGILGHAAPTKTDSNAAAGRTWIVETRGRASNARTKAAIHNIGVSSPEGIRTPDLFLERERA